MIIYRAFYRESLKTTGAITLVLLVIFVFLTLTVLLGRTVKGQHADDILFTLLTLQTLRRLDLLLPLGLYLGVLLTFSRWYRDSEMSALFACGVGLPRLVSPVLTLGLGMAILTGALSFYVNPLMNALSEKAKIESARRPEVALLTPGVFAESGGSGRVIYAERYNESHGSYEGVFLSRLSTENPGVVTARAAIPFTDKTDGDRFVILENGRIYDGYPGASGFRQWQFERLTLRFEPRKVVESPPSLASLPTLQLFKQGNKDAIAELHWRLARPLSILVLVVFALVLAYTDARRGKLANLFLAILVYLLYSNFLSFGQTLIRKETVPGWIGLFWVHGLAALIAYYLFARRAYGFRLRSYLKRSRHD